MDVGCRWLGSVHNAKVFCKSRINKWFHKNEIPMICQQILSGRSKIDSYLIGDPANPLTHHCMKNIILTEMMRKLFLTIYVDPVGI